MAVVSSSDYHIERATGNNTDGHALAHFAASRFAGIRKALVFPFHPGHPTVCCDSHGGPGSPNGCATDEPSHAPVLAWPLVLIEEIPDSTTIVYR